MNTFRRCALLAVVLGAVACSSSVVAVDEVRDTQVHTSFDNSPTSADSSANRGGGNLMGGN